MSLRDAKFWAVLTAVVVLVTGCQPARPFYFFEDGDLSHYRGVATEVEYPDVNADTIADVSQSAPPLTLDNPEPTSFWPLHLEEAIRNTLSNSKVMRTIGGQVLRPPTQVTQVPTSVQTVYNPAVVESDPRFGVEGTLSQFDTQWSTNVFWQKNDHPVNLNLGGLVAGVLNQDAAQFQTQLQKTTATGDRVFIRNNTSYDQNNNPSNLFPSVWNTNFEAEFRHPFLQGAGLQFNRIAGPSGIPGVSGFANIPGVYNGVAIARIQTDIAIADFESDVRDVVAETELAYWELYFAYRNLDALVVGRDSALSTWRKVKALYDAGARGGEAEKEAQAREQYFLFRGQVENAVSNVYEVENRLRYMMGLTATDGRLIRPADDPPTAKVDFEWQSILVESLARTPELRRQKWVVKQQELQLIASKNFLLPRIDATGIYRWVGFGNDLWYAHRTPDFDTAMSVLTGGRFQEWQLGLQANVPIGFRAQLSGVRNAQLQLARARAILQDQELEQTHQLAAAVRDLERAYKLTETNFNRRIAAEVNVRAVRAAYETDTVTLDLLLDAQRRLAVAESDYFRSLVDYAIAIRTVHLRKNSLLEYNNVYLAEGPWPGKAYFDARKRGRERDAGFFVNYGFFQPNVFSRGPINQKVNDDNMIFPGDGAPSQPQPESVPTPAPRGVGSPSDAMSRNFGAPAGLPAGGAADAPRRLPAASRDTLSYDWGSINRAAEAPASPASPAVRQTTYNASPRGANRSYESGADYTTAGADRPVAVRPGP
ncbi:MAG: TolC family protein [Planctomycetia bacterium]|nr:TolC family protein [Planctomycetia bacterium]